MAKEIEELTDDDLAEVWGEIGGTPHLFEQGGKDELRHVLTTGECSMEYEFAGKTKESAIGLQLDYYTMAAIVNKLTELGYETPFSVADEMAQQTMLGSEVIGCLEWIRANGLKHEKGKWIAHNVNNKWLGYYGEATDLQVYEEYKRQDREEFNRKVQERKNKKD